MRKGWRGRQIKEMQTSMHTELLFSLNGCRCKLQTRLFGLVKWQTRLDARGVNTDT